MEKRKRTNKKVKTAGNGEGSLYFSQTLKKWFYYYTEPNGVRKALKQRKKETTTNFKKRVTELKNQLNTGTYILKSNITFLSILESYYNQKLKDRIISESSFIIYTKIINIFKKKAKFVNYPIQKITTKDIETFKDEIRGYSNETINKIWSCLKIAFKIAYSRRIVIYNIMLDETLKKPFSLQSDVKIEALTIDEEKKLIEKLEKSKNIYSYACLLQLYTGARIGEILGLCQDCIDLKNNTLTIKRTITKNKNNTLYLSEHTKGYKISNSTDKGKRTFYMRPEVLKIIKILLSQKEKNIKQLLFWDKKKNNFIEPNYINQYLKSLNKRFNITNKSLHTHVLRHTFITRSMENGINLKVLQYLIGHIRGSSITLDIYTSVTDEFIKREMEKFG